MKKSMIFALLLLTMMFTEECFSLNPPQLISPANGQTGISMFNTQPIFSWHPVENASDYNFHYEMISPVFFNPFLDGGDIWVTDTFCSLEYFSSFSVYKWYVTAYDESYNQETSEERIFITEAPAMYPWNFFPKITSASIIVPFSIQPEIYGNLFLPGDAIGAFYTDEEGYWKCGGASYWNGFGDIIIDLSGDDPNTPEKDGFVSGDTIHFRIYDNERPGNYMASVTYQSGSPIFTVNDTSILAGIIPYPPNLQTLSYGYGWHIISSNIIPQFPNFLNDMLNDWEYRSFFIKDEVGNVFWPEWGVNDIGQWDLTKGYMVFGSSWDEHIDIPGWIAVPDSTPIQLTQGWHIISYLRNTTMNIVSALASINNNYLLVKDGLGNVYWPDWGINDIENMQPGQGYQIYMNQEGTLVYPPN